MRVRVGDGRQFNRETPGKPTTTSSFSTPFGARDVPKHLTDAGTSCKSARRALVAERVGVASPTSWRPASQARSTTGWCATYQEAFEEVFILDVPGDVNNIFLALPRVQPLGQGELRA